MNAKGDLDDTQHFCVPCKAVFASTGAFNVHVAAIHGGITPPSARAKISYQPKHAEVIKVRASPGPKSSQSTERESPSSINDSQTLSNKSLNLSTTDYPATQGTASFKCPVCFISYSSRVGFMNHTRQIHPESKLKPPPLLKKTKVFKCHICDFQSASKSSLRHHTTECHGCTPPNKFGKSIRTPFKCDRCFKSFPMRSHMNAHKLKVHKETIQKRGNFSCQLCSFRSVLFKGLLSHYELAHNYQLTLGKVLFSSVADFQKWRANLEAESCTKFVGANRPLQHWQYLFCNRSGKGKVSKKRRVERQQQQRCRRWRTLRDDYKIGGYCSAYMKFRLIAPGDVTVEYCANHIGHDITLSHLSLSDTVKTSIMAKLASGMSQSEVFAETKAKVRGKIGRDGILSRQDVTNLRVRLGYHVRKNRLANLKRSGLLSVVDIEKDVQDKVSTERWLNSWQEHSSNPLVFHERSKAIEDGQEEEYFAIGLQTSQQCEILQTHSDGIICVDSLSSEPIVSKASVVSVICADHEGNAQCVAWLVTNHWSISFLQGFFQALKDKCGEIKTSVLFRHHSDVFLHAWSAVFQAPKICIVSDWHSAEMWKKLLSEHIPNPDKEGKRRKILALLKDVQQQATEAAFWGELQKVLEIMSAVSQQLSAKFASNFIGDSHWLLWAHYCYPDLASIREQLLEHLLKVLEDGEFLKKQTSRTDGLLLNLMCLSKEISIENLTKVMDMPSAEDVHSAIVSEILRVHKTGEEISQIVKIDGKDLWQISWQSSSGVVSCKITLTCGQCPVSCMLRCPQCQVCVHMYVCSCSDFLLRPLMCKHVHVVHESSLLMDQLTSLSPEPELQDETCATADILDSDLTALMTEEGNFLLTDHQITNDQPIVDGSSTLADTIHSPSVLQREMELYQSDDSHVISTSACAGTLTATMDQPSVHFNQSAVLPPPVNGFSMLAEALINPSMLEGEDDCSQNTNDQPPLILTEALGFQSGLQEETRLNHSAAQQPQENSHRILVEDLNLPSVSLGELQIFQNQSVCDQSIVNKSGTCKEISGSQSLQPVNSSSTLQFVNNSKTQQSVNGSSTQQSVNTSSTQQSVNSSNTLQPINSLPSAMGGVSISSTEFHQAENKLNKSAENPLPVSSSCSLTEAAVSTLGLQREGCLEPNMFVHDGTDLKSKILSQCEEIRRRAADIDDITELRRILLRLNSFLCSLPSTNV